MRRQLWRALACLLLPGGCSTVLFAQKPLSWEEVSEGFRNNNLNPPAGRTFVRESGALEITAGLRPNPILSVVNDQFHVFYPNPLQQFKAAQWASVVSQLFERRRKQQLRQGCENLATSVATTDRADQERLLTFAPRNAFIPTLQTKSVVELASANLKYYPKVVEVSRDRFEAGDISRVDLERMELKRVESDLVNAQVNLRTAKIIALLALMKDRQPVDSFGITGEFDFRESILLPSELPQAALSVRPQRKSPATTMRKAQNDNRQAWADGSTGPIVGLDRQRTQGDTTIGLSLQIPIRIFDRNQGEKARTALEVRRSEQVRQGIVIAVDRDVDSAYATLESVRTLLRPYRERYPPQGVNVRETICFTYTHGGASLLEFLDAQKAYRDTRLTYRNLAGTYLAAANQFNLAVGREVIP